MNLSQTDIKTTYFRYLGAAFGSSLIGAIYSIVDMAMVGQYQGPNGTAALAVVAPVWNIVYSLGLLTGIGGSVLFSTASGQGDIRKKNEYFTTALLGTLFLAMASWFAVIFLDTRMLRLFGAEATLLPYAKQYLRPIKFAVPLFLFNQMLSAFLRNDDNPSLATAAVLAGGIFNIFGDYLFVFTFRLGIFGAGLATAIGAAITFLVMLIHFFSKKNTLRVVWPVGFLDKTKRILVTGFSTFFIDVAMGILTVLFNRQIIGYLGIDALAVYGVIVNISTIVQCCAYSVGQAAQPILSVNFGAKQWDRIKETLKYSLYSSFFFGTVWLFLVVAFPNGFISVFMTPTDGIYRIAPFIMRCYGISFLLLPFNVFSTYYFQAIMKPGAAFFVSVSRGLVLSGSLIYLLPVCFGPNAIWFTMPITELIVATAVTYLMRKSLQGFSGAHA